MNAPLKRKLCRLATDYFGRLFPYPVENCEEWTYAIEHPGILGKIWSGLCHDDMEIVLYNLNEELFECGCLDCQNQQALDLVEFSAMQMALRCNLATQFGELAQRKGLEFCVASKLVCHDGTEEPISIGDWMNRFADCLPTRILQTAFAEVS